MLVTLRFSWSNLFPLHPGTHSSLWLSEVGDGMAYYPLRSAARIGAGPAPIRPIHRRNPTDYSIVRLVCPSICRRCSSLRTLSSGEISWCNGSPSNCSGWSPSLVAIESVEAQSRQDSIYLARKPLPAPENWSSTPLCQIPGSCVPEFGDWPWSYWTGSWPCHRMLETPVARDSIIFVSCDSSVGIWLTERLPHWFTRSFWPG